MGDFAKGLLEFNLITLIMFVGLVALPFLLNSCALVLRKASGEQISFKKMLKAYGVVFLVVISSALLAILGSHLQQDFLLWPILVTVFLGGLASALVCIYFCLSIILNIVFILLGKMGELRR